MAAKKAAAKKAAPKAAPKTGLGPFPLPPGHYFHPPVVAAAAHDGSDLQSNGPLRLLQRALGAPETGYYDEATVSAVRAWKDAQGLDASPVIDANLWERMREDT